MNWTEYTGSDEQIAEINSCINWVGKDSNGTETDIKFPWHLRKDGYIEVDTDETGEVFTIIKLAYYWIIPDDPLREMKVRQAMTKQPTWQRYTMQWGRRDDEIITEVTTDPDWNIPNAEYSFTEFKDPYYGR